MISPSPSDKASSRIQTGVPGLDTILYGGLPRGSVIALGGAPGSGKTILSHQIGFSIASAECKVIYFQTLSEPTAKRLRFLKDFSYFEASKVDQDVYFIDLGEPLKTEGINAVLTLVLEHVKRERPGLVVLDSFKALGDFVSGPDEFRKFSYEIVVQLMAWECTVLFVGEFTPEDFRANPLFSVIDGLIIANQRLVSGEQRRILQVVKMRGTDHSREPHTFKITRDGIQVYAPSLTLRRDPEADRDKDMGRICPFGEPQMDKLLNGGFPRGSSLLVSGVAGSGKTVSLLEFLYLGAKRYGEKGLFISFEETVERIYASALSLGWDLETEIERGMIEIIFVPQPDVRVEEDLDRIDKAVKRFHPQRIAIDSLSVFLDKVESTDVVREKVFQLATIAQNAGAVGLLATTTRYGDPGISRCGVEETVVDGVIVLSAEQNGMNRERFIEIFKLRNTAHVMGRHRMTITKGGLAITPHELPDEAGKVRRKASGKKSHGASKKKNKSRKA